MNVRFLANSTFDKNNSEIFITKSRIQPAGVSGMISIIILKGWWDGDDMQANTIHQCSLHELAAV